MQLVPPFARYVGSLGAATIMLSAVAPGSLAQSSIPSDRPPAEFVRTWQEAVGGFGISQKEAVATLGKNPAWEPYFRAAFNASTDQKTRDILRPALVKCQADLFAWNLGRA